MKITSSEDKSFFIIEEMSNYFSLPTTEEERDICGSEIAHVASKEISFGIGNTIQSLGIDDHGMIIKVIRVVGKNIVIVAEKADSTFYKNWTSKFHR